MIESLAWVLPRPRPCKYPGGFPLHAEKKLLREIGINPVTHPRIKILHPFGGMADYGVRMDIQQTVRPDVMGDAHKLPFKDGLFDVVFLDPPYTDQYSKDLYGTEKLIFSQYIREAVRVCAVGGYIIVYHYAATPWIEGTQLIKRVFIETRIWHKLRCVHIHLKAEAAGKEEK